MKMDVMTWKPTASQTNHSLPSPILANKLITGKDTKTRKVEATLRIREVNMFEWGISMCQLL